MSKLVFVKKAPSFLWAYITWLRRYSNHPEKYPLDLRYKKVRQLIIKSIDGLKLDFKVNNLEYLTKHESTFLGVSNHRFFMDPAFYIYISEKPVSFIAKKETQKIPLVGRVIKALDGFFIDREDILSQVRLFKQISERMKKNDISYFIFPEGTRMKNKDQIHTLPYKDGSLKPAYWADKDIIYCAMIGNERALDKKDPNYKKRNVTMTIFEPLKHSDFASLSTTDVMPKIEKNTNEELVKLFDQNKARGYKIAIK